MKKIKINVLLESSETNSKITSIAEIEENTIKYSESDGTIVTLNIKDNILIRENEKLLMTFEFNKSKITTNEIFIKELKQILTTMIETKNIICKNNYYKVEYEIIDNDKFKYIIEIGEAYE